MTSPMWMWIWAVSYTHLVAFSTTEAAMRACKAEGVREAVCTMWQDDGAETPMAVSYTHLFETETDMTEFEGKLEDITA